MKLNLRNINLSIIIIILTGFVSLSARQGSSPKAFSEILIGGNFVWNGSMGELDEYWNSGTGADGFIQTPFYAGDIKIGFTYLPFTGKDEYHADFNSYYINLGWNENLFLTNSISLNIGAKIGSFIMSFDDDTLDEFRTQESEIGLAAEAGIKYGLSSAINIHINAEFLLYMPACHMRLPVRNGSGVLLNENSIYNIDPLFSRNDSVFRISPDF
jgi:hypothetical protein